MPSTDLRNSSTSDLIGDPLDKACSKARVPCKIITNYVSMKSEKEEDKMTIMLSIVRTWRQAHKEFQGNLLEQAYELNDSA